MTAAVAARSSVVIPRCMLVVAVLCKLSQLGGSSAYERSTRELRDSSTEEADDPLFLTPYIENHDTSTARAKSVVSLFAVDYGIPDVHSGYITVNDTAGTNLFFMLIKRGDRKSLDDMAASSTPLLLWLQGGPGQTSLLGEFLENGPLGLQGDGKLYRRKHALTEQLDVVYLDQPAGAGYSFTKDITNGFARTLEDMSRDTVEFLRQFLILFPEYNGRDFYIAGESYGSRISLSTAYRLHRDPSKVNATLKGVIHGVGFWFPIVSALDTSNYFRALGLLDHNGYKMLSERAANITALISEGKNSEALSLMGKSFWISKNESDPTLFQKLTGYEFVGNVLQSKEPPVFRKFEELARKSHFRKAIHVGKEAPYRAYNKNLRSNLLPDYFRDLTDMAVAIMNNYKVLVYVGQLDATFAQDRTHTFFSDLPWHGTEDFNAADHRIWYVNEGDARSAGYVTCVRNFTYVTLARAGHYPGHDEPEATADMFFRFINDRFEGPVPRGYGTPEDTNGKESTQQRCATTLLLYLTTSAALLLQV